MSVGNDQWKKYLQMLRAREIEIAFKTFPEKHFDNAIELGAGDGFQSNLLFHYVKNLVSTEIDPGRLKICNRNGIEYRICDAEIIDTYFENRVFDLVFASNLFEHLPSPTKALSSLKNIINRDSVIILIMPSAFWAICHFTLYYPVKIKNYIQKRFEKRSSKTLCNKLYETPPIKRNSKNNFKAKPFERNKIWNIFRWPFPHGVSKNHISEILNFRKEYWSNVFSENGFELLKTVKGPAMSGYGLRLNKIRMMVERLGLTGEYVYYIKLR